jgi:hypothetical protein
MPLAHSREGCVYPIDSNSCVLLFSIQLRGVRYLLLWWASLVLERYMRRSPLRHITSGSADGFSCGRLRLRASAASPAAGHHSRHHAVVRTRRATGMAASMATMALSRLVAARRQLGSQVN